MRQIVGWFHRVYPPLWAVLIVLLFFAATEGLFWWTRLAFGVSIDSVVGVLQIRDSLILMSASGYAAFRVCAFHPIFRPKYRAWLELMPWTADKPLPLGPVTLVVQDLVMLVLMRAILHDYQMLETSLPLVFLYSYVAVATAAIWASGERGIGLVLLFGGGAAIRSDWWTPWAALLVLAACYGVVIYGMRRSLLAFPWTAEIAALRKHFVDARQISCGELPAVHLGWPYYLLNAEDTAADLPRRERIMLSLAAGWLVYALAAGFSYDEPENVRGVSLVVGCLTLLCSAGRLVLYYWNYWPPISFLGRLRTGRWIIPAYDIGLVAPITIAVVGWGGLSAIRVVPHQQPLLVAPLVGALVATVLGLTFLTGPSHRHWRLTAPCRIKPAGLGMANQFEKL